MVARDTALYFRNKGTRDIVYDLNTREARSLLPRELHRRAKRLVALLDTIRSPGGLSSPGLRLEKLAGNRKGQWSIRINDKYRICFNWRDEDVEDVEIVDYH